MSNPREYSKLLSPIMIGGKIFRNRLITGSHVLTQLEDFLPRPTKAYMDHFVELAKGGAACVVIGGPSAFEKLDINGKVSGESGFYNIYGVEYMRTVKEMVDRVHSYGALACMQHDFHIPYGYTCSPGISTIPLQAEPMSKGEMTPEIMDKVAEAFANAAQQAVILGYDMMQLHMASGGMFQQFLSCYTNKRTDEYNGNMAARARFPLMVIDRIRQKVGNKLLLEIKVCCDEFIEPNGITIDEAIEFMKLLEGRVNLIYLAAGNHWSEFGLVKTASSMYDEVNPYIEWARKIKAAGVNVPLEISGGFQNPREMEQVLEEGLSEFVNVVRGALADPQLMNKTYHGEVEDIRPCLQCNHCMRGVGAMGFDCSVNPRIGREHLEEHIVPAKAGQRLAVVGGGPAGMLAAITAAERGYAVTLYEQSNHLGGNTEYAQVPFKKRLRSYLAYLENKVTAVAKIELSTKVTPNLLDRENYDRVILAIGADQFAVPIPGAKEHGVLIRDFYRDMPAVGKNVVIIGGGVSGCETALYLARRGIHVTILEMADSLGSSESRHPTQGFSVTFTWLEYHLSQLKQGLLQTVTSARCTGIGSDYVTYEKNGETITLSGVDTVILATGMVAKTTEALKLWRDGSKTAMIGDCKKVGNIETATRTAYDAAINI